MDAIGSMALVNALSMLHSEVTLIGVLMLFATSVCYECG